MMIVVQAACCQWETSLIACFVFWKALFIEVRAARGFPSLPVGAPQAPPTGTSRPWQ
jgi:hypothetical protein